jgi:hypothetical protein
MVVTQGFYCDISEYSYIVPQFGSSPPLFSLLPCYPLKMTLAGFNISYSCMYGKYLNHIDPSYALHLPFSFC